MVTPTSVVIDGREYIPKTPAANVEWTLGQYLQQLRRATGRDVGQVARATLVSAVWLQLLEDDVETIRVPFPNILRLARFYHADLELLALCYEATHRPAPPAEDTEVAGDETDEVHDNEAAVGTDYLALSDPGDPEDG